MICMMVHRFGTERNFSTTFGSTVMKHCTDTHGPQRMNRTDCGDPYRATMRFTFVF